MKVINSKDFDRFLDVARSKATPQRLFLVFAEKEYAREEEMFDGAVAAAGGFAIKPLMYIDKPLAKLTDFNDLLKESLENGKPWDLLYVSASEDPGLTEDFINQRLELMVKMIHQGITDKLLIFNQSGDMSKLAKLGVQPRVKLDS
ncbi:MAG: hypothetical protein M0Q95_10215 [Porticoccaceae bacterium]|nr:hypothetical protein [Porticoccaceae bacterium]